MKSCSCSKKSIAVLITIATVVIVWGLLFIPVIFFYLPTNIENVESDNTACSSAISYSTNKNICLKELQEASKCSSNSENDLLVINDAEEDANIYINGLELLRPSETCRNKFIPLLCLYLFGLCSSSGVPIQPTSSQCQDVRDIFCKTEWNLALSLGNISESSINTSNNVIRNCSEGFFKDPKSQLCTPSCYTWSHFTSSQVLAGDVVYGITFAISVIFGTVTAIIACIKHDKLLQFPSTLLFYMDIDIVVGTTLFLVSIIGGRNLHCFSQSFIESLQRITPFCIITGVVFTYLLIQISLWWIFHVIIFFWSIFFPYNYRSLFIAGKLKLIHFVCLILGILLPFISLISIMGSFAQEYQNSPNNISFWSAGAGFQPTRFPAILCSSSNRNANFYAVNLPLVIISAIGCSLIVVIIARIATLRINKYKSEKAKMTTNFASAEKKLLVILCYYVILPVGSLSSFALGTRDQSRQIQAIQELFVCEQQGIDPSNPCDRTDLERFNHLEISIVSVLLICLYPVVYFFLFVLNKCKKPNLSTKTQDVELQELH